jgi:hypothetical protein
MNPLNAYHLRIAYKNLSYLTTPHREAEKFRRHFVRWNKSSHSKYLAFAVEQIPENVEKTTYAIHLSFFSRKKKKAIQQSIYRHFYGAYWRGKATLTHYADQPNDPSAKVFHATLMHEPIIKLCAGFSEEMINTLHSKAMQMETTSSAPDSAPYKPRSKKARAAFAKLAERMAQMEHKLDRVLALLSAISRRADSSNINSLSLE